MIQFITENLSTIIITASLAGVVALIIIKMIRDKKRGKAGCGSCCSGCPSSSFCHPECRNK
ncbi:MAG: FeoB-associated Cys-rich membrane protein [Eubacteriales bacterium]|nr:FeoB-associated Cys-rich membrane protein [Eubacteriales bacterium]MDD4474481.1 FeoB-associated Cys-rich membrane protein [Eubacteriales bacterium]